MPLCRRLNFLGSISDESQDQTGISRVLNESCRCGPLAVNHGTLTHSIHPSSFPTGSGAESHYNVVIPHMCRVGYPVDCRLPNLHTSTGSAEKTYEITEQPISFTLC